MSYKASAARLQQLFLEHDYEGLMKKGSRITVIVDTLSNGSSIRLTFPGYKARPGFFDYRVELVKDGVAIPLSHMNIVVDLVNKAVHQGIDVDRLRAALERHAVEGALDFSELNGELPYQQNAPSSDLLRRAGTSKGNESDLTLEELFTAIHWIALQEDINYPIAKNLKGRKMSYYRYAEALHGAKYGNPTIEELIPRTQFKGKPPELLSGVDYAFTHRIQ